MRGILPAAALSLLIWAGIASGVINLADHLLPNLLPAANHQMHQVVAQARRIVLAQAF